MNIKMILSFILGAAIMFGGIYSAQYLWERPFYGLLGAGLITLIAFVNISNRSEGPYAILVAIGGIAGTALIYLFGNHLV